MPRILTYNVHRWLGTDRRISPGRVADVIAACEADIVALQEVRVGRMRHGALDQAVAVAMKLGMDLHFQPTIRIFGEQFGIALMTRHPSHVVRAARLPNLSRGAEVERRSALWVRVEIEGNGIHVVNAHLSLRSRDRLHQAQTLVGHEWLGHPLCTDPAILLGDFNAPPQSRTYHLLAARFRDVQRIGDARPKATFHTRAPMLRLDHIFVTESFQVMSAAPVKTPLSRIASDHFPLLADLRVESGVSGKEQLLRSRDIAAMQTRIRIRA